MKLAWLTDIHLNFLETEERIQFYNDIIKTKSNAVLITGDIAEAPSVSKILKEMADQIKIPIYFVLGNHDYYRGSISEVKTKMATLTKTNNQLYWLPALGSQILEEGVMLLGQDGWADGRLGDYANSPVRLNDSRLIEDLFHQKILGQYPLLDKMQQLADADAKFLHDDLKYAISQHPKKIIVLTHVPPFKESCLYQGNMTDDNYLPYFSSKATGDVLTEMAKKHTAVDFLILCGHTHEASIYKPFDNLTVLVGKAEYYQPEVQKVKNNKLFS